MRSVTSRRLPRAGCRMRGVARSLVLAGLLISALSIAGDRVELKLPDLDGEMLDIAQYRGKWVVVNYWATWCPPCIQEIPELVAFHARHADDDAVVVGVNTESLDDRLLRDFVVEMQINYPILREDPERMSPFSRMFGLPTSYIIGPDGSLVTRHNGPLTAKQLEEIIRVPPGNPGPGAGKGRYRT